VPKRQTKYPTIRAAIQAGVKAAGLTTGEIERRLPRDDRDPKKLDKPIVSRRMLDLYLRDDGPDLSSRRLDALMDLLGLRIVG
jgi:hypothetical protein